MQIYLPIAEMSVNGLLVLIMGGVVGFLSGMFGVGGGFLMTPLLIFIGVPPAIAVGTQANQLVAASVSGVLAHWRRKNVDVKLGLVMLVGGAGGTALGVWVFGILQTLGQIDLVIALSYVLFLGGIGGLMLVESVGAMMRGPQAGRAAQASQAYLAARPAVQDAVPALAPVHQRAAAGRHRLRRRPDGRASWASAAASCWCRR